MITTNEIRRSFIDFFKSKGHQEVASSSLVPVNDETLLFTNAGMVQFKDVFLGADKRSYTRAVSSQKCVRAGGKHNDLENVGYTARHHTFFEMLGNFSFGDYFKRDAIFYAWEYLIEVLKLPKEKLWVTVFEEDKEAEDIWIKEVGVDPKRLSRIGAKDNFWAMGDTGPCGPCTEIFYDHGEEVAGGPPGTPEEDGDRYIEIWNLVFMQYNRLIDGTLEKLPNPSVDTGMGLERIAAVLQHVHSNYEIDIFQKLIDAAAKIVATEDIDNPSLKVLADHIRACSFLIVDGVLPSNEGRGYVLRRIIRRAVRHGDKLGAMEIFFYRLVATLVAVMAEAYPVLKEKQALIEDVLRKEEEQFEKTLSHGMKILEEEIATLDSNVISGRTAFKLYDTYGFPLDLTADIARERNLTVDEAGFTNAMEAQKARAKSASKFGVDYNQMIKTDLQTTFVGYSVPVSDAHVLALFSEGKKTDKLMIGQEGVIILNQTPFYAESGGQVADKGVIETLGSEFTVEDVQKSGSAFLHIGKVTKGSFAIDDEVTAQISNKRATTAAHHTATHLLHAALREIVGCHVEQKGSLVECNKLRFDFSNPSAVTTKQIKEVERLVNAIIRQNLSVETIETSPEVAKDMGAMALFGEKYGDIVRVLRVGDFSIELCGGTHVAQTGDIGLFKITSESGIASGVRRIEAVTGLYAENYIEEKEETLTTIHELLKSNDDNVLDKLLKLQQQIKAQDKVIKGLKQQISSGDAIAIDEAQIDDVTLISALLPNVDMGVLREKIDQYKAQKTKVVIALSTENEGKAQIAVGVSKAITDKIKAGELINFIANQVGGKGGGRPDMAQAGGNDPQNLPKAMTSVHEWVKERL
ncbi:alanine--tRNA ligase [Cysteiniphilum sp. QT6929]|uniref:alanine--tRNA ligase n=1 Tax=Cysteiniphilum sp. QT6929 TaxID=2975055 RepID=UPI0024B3BEEE|nr:alanine--tRNA ligase [Cysteiniphilum sp. QT6929]WHN66430.1 alanine--tRNA ligase [Cysteiniphilum sp. QT6929]